MERRHLYIILLVAFLLTLPFLRTTPKFYTSDANVYFHTSTLLMEDHSFSTNQRHKGWIQLNDTYYPAMPIGYSILAIPFSAPFLLDTALQGGKAVLGTGFTAPPGDIRGLWIGDEASIRVTSASRNLALLSFDVRSIAGDRNLSIVQGSTVLHADTHPDRWENVSVPVRLFEGENTVNFRSPDCEDVSALLPFEEVSGCASLVFKDFWIGEMESGEQFFRGVPRPLWVGEEPRNVSVSSPNAAPVPYRLSFDAWGYSPGNTTLTVNIGEETFSWDIPQSGRTIVSQEVILQPGVSNATFQASGRECRTLSGNDCLHVGISEIKFVAPFHEKSLLFTGKWFPEEANEVRWTSGNSGVTVKEEARTLSFSTRSFHTPRHVSIAVNGEPTKQISVPQTWKEVEIGLPTSGGPTQVGFQSNESCRIPGEVSASNDNRCLALGFRDFTAR